MNHSEFDIPPENETGAVYTTSNILIRLLAACWLKQAGILLKKINADSLYGIDVGCAEGYMLGYFHEKGIIDNLVAVDIEDRKLEYARRHYPFFNYIQADVNRLEFPDNTFDYIIATEILEHLPNPAHALEELRRVAKDGAYILVSVPHEPFFHWGNLLRGKYWSRKGYTPSHLHFWHRLEFRTFLGRFAEILTEKYILNFPWLLYLGRIRKWK